MCYLLALMVEQTWNWMKIVNLSEIVKSHVFDQIAFL